MNLCINCKFYHKLECTQNPSKPHPEQGVFFVQKQYSKLHYFLTIIATYVYSIIK